MEQVAIAEVLDRRSRLWCSGIVLTITVLAFGLGSAAGSSENSLRFDQKKTAFALGTVVTEVHDACAETPTEKLDVEVQEPTSAFSVEIDCAAALASTYTGIQEPLVHMAARHRRAGERADRAVALQDSLPPAKGLTFDRDELVWSLAGSNGFACQRAQSPEQIQHAMADSAQAGLETAEHWTLIEAAFLEGACPDKLSDLYRHVAELGNPTAAETVKELVARKPVVIPLASIRQGVSARSVDGRPVFLDRRGNNVTAFVADPHHQPDGRELWYCPTEKVFVAPKYGEMFNADGTVAGGPPPRGLDRFKTTSARATATVHLRNLVRGSTTRKDRDLSTTEARGNPANWNTSPDQFCFQALKNNVTSLG